MLLFSVQHFVMLSALTNPLDGIAMDVLLHEHTYAPFSFNMMSIKTVRWCFLGQLSSTILQIRDPHRMTSSYGFAKRVPIDIKV